MINKDRNVLVAILLYYFLCKIESKIVMDFEMSCGRLVV